MTAAKTSLNAPAASGATEERSSWWSRLVYWITIALDPEAVAWNWGGFTPALLSYSEALRATARPASEPAATDIRVKTDARVNEDAPAESFQRAA